MSESEPEGREHPLTVLIVEDDANLRAALVALVSREGAVVHHAATLEEARKRLAETSLDAVLVDLTLPDGSGLDLLGDPEAHGAPEYIVVTGDGTAETAVQALKRGALDYLTKPVDRARLRSILANVQRTRVLKNEVVDLRGQLREDLFYRLNVFPIELPPLRMRDEDAGLLAEHFLEQVNAREGTRKRLTPRALARLQALSWPGNVRELKNAVERAAILADVTIDADAFPLPHPGQPIGEDATLQVRIGTPIEEIERRLILATLESLDGHKGRTAEALGISLKTLYTRLSVYQAQGQGGRAEDPSH